MKKCVFSGTFDPPTRGHEQIIKTCLEIFDEVVVALMLNPQKTPCLSEEERIFLLKKMFENENRVKVKAFSGAAVDVLESENTRFYVRGVRNTVDFEYENSDFFASKKLKEDIVVIYIPCEQGNLHISSSLIRNSAKFNKTYDEYIPEAIAADLKKFLEKRYV
mgnify:CR=1 FL=1